GVYFQGGQVDTVSTVAGQVVTKTYENVTITNGQLAVHLRDLGGTDYNAVIEGMEVVRADDPALSGWTVQLKDSSGAVVATTRSGADGSYRLTPPALGTYTVVLTLWNGSAATYTFEKVVGTTVLDTAGGPNVHDGTLVGGGSVGTVGQFGI